MLIHANTPFFNTRFEALTRVTLYLTDETTLGDSISTAQPSVPLLTQVEKRVQHESLTDAYYDRGAPLVFSTLPLNLGA